MTSRGDGRAGARPQLSVDVTVSLTTTSRRIDQVHEIVRTLLSQTVAPSRIVLWLSSEPHLLDRGVREEQIPPALQNVAGGRVLLRWTRNLGPYRKLLPAMEAFGGLIVTADDDTLYPPTWLEGLLSMHRENPGAICCYRAHRMLVTDRGEFASYWRWPAFAHSRPALDCFPTGKDGVLYPAESLHADVLDVERLLALAPASDDIWFKIMALRRGTRAVGVPGHTPFPVIAVSEQIAGLYARYNLLGNDAVLAGVCAAYGVLPSAVLEGQGDQHALIPSHQRL